MFWVKYIDTLHDLIFYNYIVVKSETANMKVGNLLLVSLLVNV